MMNKEKSSDKGIIKYALFVPLFAVLLFVNNLQAQDTVGKMQDTDNGKKQELQSKVIKIMNVPVDKNVYTHVEEMPQFPGGNAGMMKYLSQNIKYPDVAQKQGIQGTVVCRFIVNSVGEVSDVTVLRSLSPETDGEAIRVVNAMPKWTPGKQGGKEVDVYYTLPIRFKLSDDNASREKKVNIETISEDVIFEVDGKVITKEEFANLNPDKIESVNVIKDKSGLNKSKVIIKSK